MITFQQILKSLLPIPIGATHGVVQFEPLFLKSLLLFENELIHQEISIEMVDIVRPIIILGMSIIVLQALMNILVAKAVATFCHICLHNHIKGDPPV